MSADPGRGDLVVHQPCVFLNVANIMFGRNVRIDAFVKIEGGSGVSIGNDVHVASFCHVNVGGGKLVIEDGAVLSSGVRIVTGSNVPAAGRSCSSIAPGNVIERGLVVIKRNAAIFAGATILPGVTVGENAVVGAGAVVTRDVLPFEVVAGVPARRVGHVVDGGTVPCTLTDLAHCTCPKGFERRTK